MPFEEKSMVMQREEFCRLASKPGANVRELCRRAGISPTTGYKWLARYRLEGAAGLAGRSRRPPRGPSPSPSTITAILRRHDRLDGPGTGEARAWTRFEHAAPNDLWQMDFKGHFAL